MKSKRWGFAGITAAVIATFCVVGAAPAHADPTGPTVTSVDRDGSFPVVHIDWGSNSDAPVGVLESVDGYKLGNPVNMGTVSDDIGTSPGLRSYRAAACYARCDLESIEAGNATLVQGDWLRPDVSSLTTRPGPTMYASWQGQSGGFSLDIDPSTNPDMPAIGLYRNGEAIAVHQPTWWGSWYYLDEGASGDTVTYAATACYADCTLASLSSGFAQQTATGSASTTEASASPIWTRMGASCTPTAAAGDINAPLEVGMVTVCTVDVYDSVYSTELPGGTAEFHSDDDALLPPTSCVLKAAAHRQMSCDLPIAPQPGAEGVHAISLRYVGDADHSSSSIDRNWGVNPPAPPARTSTGIGATCSPNSIVAGNVLTCRAIVSDWTGALLPDGSEVDFSFSGSSIAPQTCRLVAGSCQIQVTPRADSGGPLTVTAQFPGDATYAPSPELPMNVTVLVPTALVAKPAIANVVSPTKVNLAMSATLTDAVDHAPIAGEVVRFVANGTTLCTGVTDASGVATCSGLTQVAQAANGYKAFFDGNETTFRLKSSTSGSGVRV